MPVIYSTLCAKGLLYKGNEIAYIERDRPTCIFPMMRDLYEDQNLFIVGILRTITSMELYDSRQ